MDDDDANHKRVSHHDASVAGDRHQKHRLGTAKEIDNCDYYLAEILQGKADLLQGEEAGFSHRKHCAKAVPLFTLCVRQAAVRFQSCLACSCGWSDNINNKIHTISVAVQRSLFPQVMEDP